MQHTHRSRIRRLAVPALASVLLLAPAAPAFAQDAGVGELDGVVVEVGEAPVPPAPPVPETVPAPAVEPAPVAAPSPQVVTPARAAQPAPTPAEQVADMTVTKLAEIAGVELVLQAWG